MPVGGFETGFTKFPDPCYDKNGGKNEDVTEPQRVVAEVERLQFDAHSFCDLRD